MLVNVAAVRFDVENCLQLLLLAEDRIEEEDHWSRSGAASTMPEHILSAFVAIAYPWKSVVEDVQNIDEQFSNPLIFGILTTTNFKTNIPNSLSSGMAYCTVLLIHSTFQWYLSCSPNDAGPPPDQASFIDVLSSFFCLFQHSLKF